ncbi:MAG: HAMP domain-containing histidine kinase, partial [Clostridiales bacterium]|nr:HAMP domain-containing histidine kinase [Candidatus Apopatocola equi]
PLTAITGWAETMAYDETMTDDSRRGLEIITREAGRLTKMVEDLLEFTRIQDGRFTLRMGEINLPELVEDTLYTYSELFRQEGMTVSYDPPEELYPDIPGDAERLQQVLLNLLDNACKYGRSGKHIEVAVKRTGTSQAVSIRDHGPGVPPEELPKIKNRFYKGSSKERGNGIGLAVCEEIVTRHNGRLMIYNAEGGGLLVTVTLPA